MATLDTGQGWVVGDPSRVLLAIGSGISQYNIDQITTCMNQLGTIDPTAVASVRTLLDDWDTANTTLQTSSVNNDGSVKYLSKADVLEWELAPGQESFSIYTEFQRINRLLNQYFSFCPISTNTHYTNTVSLIRS